MSPQYDHLNYQGLFVFEISFSPVLKTPTLFPWNIQSYSDLTKTVILKNRWWYFHILEILNNIKQWFCPITTTKTSPSSPSVPHLQVGSLEQNLRQGAEHVTDVEGAVVSMGKQLATVKQVGKNPSQWADRTVAELGSLAQFEIWSLLEIG